MTVTKEHIKHELDSLNEEQLEEVAVFIASIKFRTQSTNTSKRRLSEFYGSLPATIPYPGKEAIRQMTAEALAQDTLAKEE